MVDLTAPIEKYGETGYITHLDLYYTGKISPLSSLITDCVLIDLTSGVENFQLENLKGINLINKGNSVILKTGWEKYRGTPIYANSPWVDRKIIEFLVERQVSLILIDSPGIYGGAASSDHNEIDRYLADNEAYAVENLVNVGEIRQNKFKLFCFPIHMTVQNYAPCRVIADVVV